MSRAVMLVLLVAWHAALVALPMAAVMLAGLRCGVRDTLPLALFALCGGGLAAYALFWIWWLSPTAGAACSIAAIAAAAAAIAWLIPQVGREGLGHLSPIGLAAAVWIAYALFILAFGLAPSGFDSPLALARYRFTPPLPVDNELPFIFAGQIAAEHVTAPMVGNWLSSDRPPLQTAYFLASLGILLPRSEVHYQVQSTLLQALWVPGMWLLLRSFGLARQAIFLALAAAMFSGFAFAHGLYTWPKLLPVVYVAVVTAIALNATRETLAEPAIAAACGAAVALSMLSHPGTVFVWAGLGAALVVLRRLPPLRPIVIAAATAFAVALPWSLYQSCVDPPGNRLAKWHLAGVVPIDSRTLGEALRDTYSNITLEELARKKLTSLEYVAGPAAAATFTWNAFTGGLDDAQRSALRTWQFFHVVVALGVLALAPLACLFPRAWRTREFAAFLRLTAICATTLVVWVLVILDPVTIHAGSLAMMCFLFAAAMLAFFAANRWLALAAFALHVALTIAVYARQQPPLPGASAQDYLAFNAVALVALAITCALLWKLSSTSNGNKP